MKIFFASPGNQLHAEILAGFSVLESFALKAREPWMIRYRPTFASMMLDSGAFSAMTTGAKIDLEEYIDFALEHRAGYDAIVNLDVISGDIVERVEHGKKNLQRMRDRGLNPLPVFHQGEPWSVLEELASCGRVGIGLQRPMREVESFLDGVFERVGGARVHGFALANEKYVGRYPFDSVDSTTWLRELLALQSVRDQASDVLCYLTPGELLRLILKKYQRMPLATAWRGREQLALFA